MQRLNLPRPPSQHRPPSQAKGAVGWGCQDWHGACEPLPQPAASFHMGCGDLLLENSSSKFLSHGPQVLKKKKMSQTPQIIRLA